MVAEWKSAFISFRTQLCLSEGTEAVVLSGSGVYDGSEVHEASAVLVHLSRAGAAAGLVWRNGAELRPPLPSMAEIKSPPPRATRHHPRATRMVSDFPPSFLATEVREILGEICGGQNQIIPAHSHSSGGPAYPHLPNTSQLRHKPSSPKPLSTTPSRPAPGPTTTIYAPDAPQLHVVDHLTGKAVDDETRNVLAESARIARAGAAFSFAAVHHRHQLFGASRDCWHIFASFFCTVLSSEVL